MRRLAASGAVSALVALGLAGGAEADTLTTIPVPESGQLEQIAFDASGTGWVSGTLNNTVYVYRVQENGTSTRFTIGAGEAQGLAVGGDGNVYVCVTHAHKIVRLNVANGTPVTQTTIPLDTTTGNGCWDVAAGAAGDPHVYFTGWDSNTIGSIDTRTLDLNTLTVPGNAQPRGIAATPGGLWVTLWRSGAIGRVDLDLDPTSYTSSALVGPVGPALEPRDVVVDQAGTLWSTLSAGLERINPLTNGQTLFPAEPTPRPWQIDVDEAGNLWFSTRSNRIGRLTQSGELAYYQLPNAALVFGIGVHNGRVWSVLERSNAVDLIPTDIRPTLGNVRGVATSQSSASVSAAIDSRGVATQYRVEYSKDASFADVTAYEAAGSVDGPQDRRVDVAGLTPGTWNFRVRATNAFGERLSDETSVTIVGPDPGPTPAPAVDLDGDGSPQPADCDDRRSDVRPGAQEILDNTTDENCDGTAEFHPPIPTRLSHAWRDHKRFTEPAVLVLRNVPANTRATLQCEGGGCPYVKRTVRFLRKRSEVSILKYLRRNAKKRNSLPKLRVGATVEITLTASDMLGRSYTFKVRRNKKPALLVGCTAAGSATQIPCPAAS